MTDIHKQPVKYICKYQLWLSILASSDSYHQHEAILPFLCLLFMRCTRPLGDPLHDLSNLIINDVLNSCIHLPIPQSQIRTVETARDDLNRSLWP
jgi:hypothetical protein